MKPSVSSDSLSRRRFLCDGARQLGWVGLATVIVSSPKGVQAGDDKAPNPFGYELGPWTKTDPKLVHYSETARFHSPHPDARRIVFGPDARLYLASGNYVSILDAQGATVGEIALGGPARCVAVAKDGVIYAGLRDHIEVFDPKGQPRGAWESPGKHPWFTGLAIGVNELFAADAGNRIIWRYDRSGKVLGRIGDKNPEKNVPGFIIPSPYLDVELHPDGLLRVNNPGRHRVEAYTTSGDFEFAWGQPTAAIEGFCGCCNPVDLAVLSDGRIVTCEKGLPRVKVYSSEGKFECVVAGTELFPENTKASDGSHSEDTTKGGLATAVDAGGKIHVLDLVTGNILVMSHRPA